MRLKRSFCFWVWMGCLALTLTLSLTGCSKKQKVFGGTGPDGPPPKHLIPKHLDRIPDAVPKVEPLSRYGNRFKKNSNVYVDRKKKYAVMPTSRGYRARGNASWYGTKFHGRRTSSGERYDMFAMTAAHRTLPLPTYAKVTNIQNGKSIIVKVNDRGPFHKDRLIDVSYVAAHKLGIIGNGMGKVEVESVDPRDHHGMPKNMKKNKSRYTNNVANNDMNNNMNNVTNNDDMNSKDNGHSNGNVNGNKKRNKKANHNNRNQSNAVLASQDLPLDSDLDGNLDNHFQNNKEPKKNNINDITVKNTKKERTIYEAKKRNSVLEVKRTNNLALETKKTTNPVATENNLSAKKNTVPGKGKVFLQLGSFNEKGNAQNLIKKLEKYSAQPSQILERNTKAGAQYRVRLGPFPNREEAMLISQKLNQLNQKEIPKSILLVQP